MKKNKKLLVLVALFLAVFAVGGTLAYLTDTTAPVTNTFTFGKVDINLSETWNEADGLNLNPGAEVVKKPIITVNAKSKPAYVFMEVVMPGKVNNKNVLALGEIDNSKWYLLSDSVSDSGTTKIYAYGSNTAMTKLSENESTTELFQKVTVNGDLKNADLEQLADGTNIVIKGYAIQADDLGGKTTPADVWAALQAQNQ